MLHERNRWMFLKAMLLFLLLHKLLSNVAVTERTIETRWIVCEGGSCPPKCQCDRGKDIVKCTNLKMNDLKEMKIPNNTRELTLERHIYKLGENDPIQIPDNFVSGCNDLVSLDLQACHIVGISRDAFKGLSHFSGILDLRYNPLLYDEISLPPETFMNLPCLTSLRFQSIVGPTRYPKDLFKYMPHLTELALDIVRNASLKAVFTGVISVETLSFNSDYDVGTAYTFQALENISISNLNLTWFFSISADALSKLQIRHSLSFTKGMMNFNDLATIMQNLSNRTNLRTLFVGDLLPPLDGRSLAVTSEFGKSLARFNITELYLIGCSITAIHYDIWKGLPKLEILDLSLNSLSISDVSLLFTLMNIDTLHSLCVCNQGPLMSEKSQPLELFESCQMPNPQDNSSQERYPRDTQCAGHCAKMYFARNVKHINLSGAKIQKLFQFDVVCFTGPVEVKSVDLSRNFWPVRAQIQFPDALYKGLITLELSHNIIVENVDLFGCGDVFGAINLHGTNLSVRLHDDQVGLFFNNATEVRALDLSSNNINELPKNVFRKQMLLRHLKLGSNALQTVNFTVSHMANLEHVDLSNNLLTSLPKSFTDELDAIVANHSLYVTLHLNPLACSCETLEFLQWVAQTDVVVDIHGACSGGSVVQDRFTHLRDQIIPNLNIHCDTSAWIVATSVSVVVAMLLVTISIALACHIEHVRYLLWRVVWKSGRKSSHRPSKVNKYGVYVAYASSAGVGSLDVNWTRQELVPRLLTKYGKERVWFWEEFPSEEPVVKSIEHGVRNSRRFILVLSSNLQTFLHNDYLSHILIAMHLRCQDEGRNLVTIVNLETVETVDMPELLHHMCRSRQPLYWSPSRVEEFWERLTENLDECPPGYAYGVRCENCSSEVLINASAPRLNYGSMEASVRVN